MATTKMHVSTAMLTPMGHGMWLLMLTTMVCDTVARDDHSYVAAWSTRMLTPMVLYTVA